MSVRTAKAARASALIDELERLELSEAFDELAVRRLSREARGLMAHDAMGAHTVLGGIAGIHGDKHKVREHYKIALEVSRRDPTVLANYATALGRAGELDEAFPAMMEAHQRVPDNISLLRHAIFVGIQGGWFERSLDLYKTWNRLQPTCPFEHESVVTKAADAARRGVFTEKSVRKVMGVAHEVRVDAKVRYAGFAVHAVFGEADRFSATMYVRTTPRHAVELESEFVERVVSDAQLMKDPGLMFVPMFTGTTVDGSDSRTAA